MPDYIQRAIVPAYIRGAIKRDIPDAEGLYPTIRCPVQILWGEDDQWIPIERGRALQAMIPRAQFHAIPNAGHLVQEDAPEAIVAALLRFLPLHKSP